MDRLMQSPSRQFDEEMVWYEASRYLSGFFGLGEGWAECSLRLVPHPARATENRIKEASAREQLWRRYSCLSEVIGSKRIAFRAGT
jgi:hypothetical protein